MGSDDYKDELFSEYKKIRNRLQATQLEDSLYVVWSYIAHLNGRNITFDKIEANKDFLMRKGIQKRLLISEWEMQTLLREIIIHSKQSIYNPKTLRKNGQFTGVINQIKKISEKVSRLWIVPNGLIMIELHRLAHRQFPWQIKNTNQDYLVRYYKIFSHPDVREVVEKRIGLSIERYFFICSFLWGYFLDKLALEYPPKIEDEFVTQEEIEKILTLYSLPFDELRTRMSQMDIINYNFNQHFDVIQSHPLIRMMFGNVDRIVCPDVTRFFWRFTDGLYYEVVNENGFDLGVPFQDYIGDILEEICKNIKFYPEEIYGSRHNQKNTIDWIVEDEKSILFVECKAKRMTNKGKNSLLDLEPLEKDLKKMAGFVVQTYKTIQEYKEGKYPSYPENNKKIYPVIVTLEHWHVFGTTYNMVKEYVIELLERDELPVEWVENMPFTISFVGSFESLVHVSEQIGIEPVMSEKISGEEIEHDLGTFLFNNFLKELKKSKTLFDKEFKDIFPEKYH